LLFGKKRNQSGLKMPQSKDKSKRRQNTAVQSGVMFWSTALPNRCRRNPISARTHPLRFVFIVKHLKGRAFFRGGPSCLCTNVNTRLAFS
jgi:hypothetical protein